jgi:hypothetical protein
MSDVTELLTECGISGIRLLLTDGGRLKIDAPKDALTPDLLARVKVYKAELLTMLLPISKAGTPDIDRSSYEPFKNSNPSKPVCRCGGTIWRDVPIHEGRSVRRDCAHCGRFIEFTIWYGTYTGHNGQHQI